MSEYIVELPMSGAADEFIAKHGVDDCRLYGYKLTGEIVRCRDCRYYYEADEYHPQGNYDRRCCKYFDAYNDEVQPGGYCAWGERMEGSE